MSGIGSFRLAEPGALLTGFLEGLPGRGTGDEFTRARARSGGVGLAALLALSGWTSARADAPTPFAPAGEGELVLYRNATLIDGAGAPPRAGMDVLVAGERIQRVLPDSAAPAELCIPLLLAWSHEDSPGSKT